MDLCLFDKYFISLAVTDTCVLQCILSILGNSYLI